jgi:hypothetical protein
MFQFPGRLRRSRRQHCDVCDDNRFLSGDYVYGRDSVCTCGAVTTQGRLPDELAELVLHDVACDTVPCPFCLLLNDGAAGVMRGRERARNG